MSAWEEVALGTLVTAVLRRFEPAHVGDGERYVGLEHVAPERGTHGSVGAREAALKSSKVRFSRGDVLFGKLRPELRKAAVARCDGVCSTDLVPLRMHAPALAHLLAFQLRSASFYARLAPLVAGGTLPRVRVDELLRLPVALPPAGDRVRLGELARLLDEARDESDRLARQVAELQHAMTPVLLGGATTESP